MKLLVHRIRNGKRPMLRSASVLIILCTVLSGASAQEQKFPYKARVTAAEVYVRSGAGEAFYPTKSLVRDTTVTVRRHDPGGWYMIDPPEESFSWIPARYVQRTGTNEGQLLESNVVVFVGSAFGDETHVWQRKLMAGEQVSIIKEQDVETLAGPKRMYRIMPPAREYRWIPGSAVLPIGAVAQQQRDMNPYEVPSQIIKQREQQEQTQEIATVPAESPQPAPGTRFTQSDRLAQITKIRNEQRQLHELDQRFRNMILSDPSQWDLENMEQAYLDLQSKAEYKPVAGQIDLRYPAIRRYRQRKAELEDLNRLTAETERRDSQLLSSQFGIGVEQPMVSGTLPLQPGQTIPTVPFGIPTSQPNYPIAVDGSMLIPNIDAAFNTTGPITTSPEMPVTSIQPPNPLNGPTASFPEGAGTKVYVGAGYVQRGTADEGSGYLLLSNEGKVLAHLKPNGNVNLEEHIGRPVGLKGNRYFDQSIKSDRIDVTGLESVTIR
jgi:uncharacterized protein YgiM (DUF1202 family)